MGFDIGLSEIQAAATRMAGRVRRTPTLRSPGLSERLGVETVVKLEGLQLGGSFRLRGCFNRLMQLDEAEKAAGLVTVSGGDHAVAMALAAQALDIRLLVLMPRGAAPLHLDLARRAGAEIGLCDDAGAAFAAAERQAGLGRRFIGPDEPQMLAGHGTLGLELTADAGGRLDHVFLGTCGGLAAAAGAALKGLDPALRLHGVATEQDAAPAGAQAMFEDTVTVPKEAALRELAWILREERVLVAPTAAATVAAALACRDRFAPGERVGLVLCGSNVALAEVDGWRARLGP